MVKVFLGVLLLCFSLFGDDFEVQSQEDDLTAKIKIFVTPKYYEQNRAYIDILFSPKSDYYTNDRVNPIKVVQTLKENGLLNLFFKKPKELTLHFKTNGSPLFFTKMMGDTLRNIGYYRYVTKESTLNSFEFIWTITLNSEYATDPLILQKALAKSGCSIVDIERSSATNWSYTIDIENGYLNLATLHDGEELKLKRSLYAHWLNVSKINNLYIHSSFRNHWYPYISYYDSSLHLLKVIRYDFKRRDIALNVPSNANYIKISDIYTLKNIKNGLVLTPSGER